MPNIDERVVQMTFDNRQFEAGVSESLKTLDDLKKALNFDEVEGSLKNIENAFNNLNLSGLADSVDFIASRFEPLGKIADKVLDGIAGKVVDTGKKVADTFFGLTDMNSGFDKYATRTKAVQTIMNATGKSLEEVEEVLDKLQEYTDETSYDFATMVETIGKFTSVGVDLKAAEIAMEGIGNEAAESGASIQQANHAMYNFAQALSQGSVKLQDWKSIATANMSTKKFKETLIDTAVELGVLEKKGEGIGSIVTTNQKQLEAGETALKKANKATKDRAEKVAAAQKKISDATKETTVDFKSFESTLQDGWLTTDVLIKSLEKYANDQSAYEAAQKALTFGDAIQSVKDALSSGWMESFNYIFGNLEEAKKLWTDVSNALYEYIAIFSNWRNKILESWHTMGGYNNMIEAATNLWQTFMNIVKGVGEALTNVFPILKPENMTQALLDGTKALKDWSAGLLEMFGIEQDIQEEEEETAEKAEEIANKTDEITDSTKEAAQAMSGLSEATKTTANNLGSVKTGLKRGMRGKEVKELQKQLMKFGFRLDKYGADGIFGPETQAALKALQREIGVAETGIMDEATKAALQTDEALQKLQEHAKKGISIGARGEDIKKLQKNLNKYLGESDQLIVDGIFGPKTQAAIKKLQKALGVAETGVWDQNTKHALKTKKILLMNIKDMNKALKEGDRNEDVKKLQQELIKGGYLDKGMADGIYGPKTKEAVKKLQKALGIKETGEWDKRTIIALNNSQQMTRHADTTAKANKKTSETAKKAAEDNKEAAKEADKSTGRTTVAMMRLQNIVKGWAAALKIAAKFAGAVAEIAGNILGMFSPLVDVAIRFGSVFGGMFENLAKDLDENDAYGSFVKKVTEAFGPFGDFIQNVADGLDGFLDAYDAFLESTGKRNTFGNFFDFLKDYIKKIPAIGFIIDIFETVKSIVGPIIAFLIDEMKKLIGWFGSDEFKQAKDSVFSWISEKLTSLREVIAKFKEDHPELTIENFITKIKEVGGWLGGKFGEGFDFIKDKFTEFKAVIDKFKEDHPELTISNIFQKIKDVFDSIRKMFSNFFSGGEKGEGGSFFDNLKERFKAFEPVLTWLEGIKDRIVKLWQSIFGGGEETKAESGITETVKAQITTFDVLNDKMGAIQRIVDWFVGIKDKLIKAWNDLTNVGRNGGPDLAQEGGFTSVFDKLGEFSKEIAKVDLGKVISTALKAIAVYSLLNVSNGIKNFGKGSKSLGKGLSNAVKSLFKSFSGIANKITKNFDFKGLSKALSERVKYGKQEKESFGTKALKLAASLLMVVAAIAIVTKVVKDNNQNDIDKALWIVGGIIVALGAIAILVSAFSKEKSTNSKGSMSGILGLCAGIFIIVLAIEKVVSIITGTNEQVLNKALIIVGRALVILGIIAVLIAAFSKGEPAGVKGILSLCAGVFVLVLALEKTIKVIKDVPVETLNNALIIVGGMLVLLGIFAVLISGTSKGKTSGVKGLLSMCIGIYVLVLALEKTVQLVTNTKNKDDLWSAVGIIGGMIVLLGTIAVLMAALSKQPKVKTSIFKSLVGAVAVLVGLMAAVVAMIAQNNPGVVWQAFAMIAILVGGLGAIAVLMGSKETDKWTNLSSAAVFLSMAFMIEKIVRAIGDVIYKIKDVNPEVLKWFFIGIDAAIGILAGLVLAFTKIPLGSILSADTGLLAFLAVLAAGMELIGSVAADLITQFSVALNTLGFCLGEFGKSTGGINFKKLKLLGNFLKEQLPELLKNIITLEIDEALRKADNLKKFGREIRRYYDAISKIGADSEAVSARALKMVQDAKDIAEAAEDITVGQNITSGIFNELGGALALYGLSVNLISEDKTSAALQTVKDANEIVNILNGITDIEQAKLAIGGLAGAIGLYYDTLSKVTLDENGNGIIPKNFNPTEVAQKLSEITSAFTPETIQTLSSYGDENSDSNMTLVAIGIENLATALGSYGTNISKIAPGDVENANKVIDKVKDINSSYDEGAVNDFSGRTASLANTGVANSAIGIILLGVALGAYAASIGNLDHQKVEDANGIIELISSIDTKLKENTVENFVGAIKSPGQTVLNQFSHDIEDIAGALGVYADGIGGLSTIKVLNANLVLNTVSDIADKLPIQTGPFMRLFYKTTTLTELAAALNAFGTAIANYYNGIKDLVVDESKVEQAKKILDSIADVAVKLAKGEDFLTRVLGGVPSINGLTDGLGQIGTDLMTFQTNLGSFDASKVEGGLGIIERFANILNGTDFSALQTVDSRTGLQIYKGTMIARAMKNLIDDIALVFDADTSDADSPITTLSGIGQKIIDALSSGVTNASIDGLNTAIFSAIDTSTFYASLSMVSVMNTLGTDLLSWVETGLKDDGAIRSLTGVIEALIPKITGAFNARYEAFKGIGQFIDMGIALGLRLNQSLVTEAAEDVAWAAYIAATKKLGIASPSKAFMWIGEMADEGLAKGLVSNFWAIKDASGEMTGKLAGLFGDVVVESPNVEEGMFAGVKRMAEKSGEEAGDSFFSGFGRALFGISKPLLPEAFQEVEYDDLRLSEGSIVATAGLGKKIAEILSSATISASAEELPKAEPHIATGLAETFKNSIESAPTEPIDQAMESLIGGIKTSFTSKWEDFKGVGQFICSGLAVGLETNKSIVTQKAEDVAWAAYLAACKKLGVQSPSKEFEWIGEMIDEGLAEGISNNSWSITDAGTKSLDEYRAIWGDLVVDPATFTTIGDGMASAAKANENAIGQFVDNAGNTISTGFDKIKTFAGTTAEVFKNNNFFDLALGGLDAQKITDAYGRYSGTIENAVKTVTEDAAEAGSEASSNSLADTGKRMLDNLSNGLLDPTKRNTIINGMNSLMSIVSRATKNEKNKEQFSSVGQYMDTGMEYGLKAGASNVTRMAAMVAWDAYVAAKNVLGIASPSKKFLWLGEMVDKGLVLGLKTYAQSVSAAAGEVADGAVDTATKGVLALSDVIGFGDVDQPVIRPVLDLSDVQNGAKTVNSMFGSRILNATSSIDIAGYIASRRKAAQEAATTKVEDYSMKELSEALKKMTEDMSGMTDEIKNMKIYMDGNTLVGYMSPRVNRTLGQQATLAGRMN